MSLSTSGLGILILNQATWVQIPSRTLNVIYGEVKARIVNLWNSKCATNVQEIIDYVESGHMNPTITILTSLFSSVESSDHIITRSSVLKIGNEIEFSINVHTTEYINRTNKPPRRKLLKKTYVRRYSVCKHCQKFGSSNPDEHETTCPYRVTLESLKK